MSNLDNCDVYYCQEPAWNVKCIVLTAFLAICYLFFPSKNYIVLGCILYFTYLALAWYDYIYNCKRNMGPTYLSLFYSKFKPQNSEQIKNYNNWHPKIKRRVQIVDYSILGIILIIIGIKLYYKFKS